MNGLAQTRPLPPSFRPAAPQDCLWRQQGSLDWQCKAELFRAVSETRFLRCCAGAQIASVRLLLLGPIEGQCKDLSCSGR